MVWQAFGESERQVLDANYEFLKQGSDALVISLNPRELVNMVFTVEEVGVPTDNVEIQILGGHRVATGDALDGATSASDVELDTVANPFTNDDELNGTYLIMTSGGEQGEGRLIIDSVAADHGVNLSHALSAQPSATETYDLYRFGVIQDLEIAVATPSEDEPNTAFTIVSGWQFVAVLARRTGVTDAHVLRMTYSKDGVNA